MGNSNKKKKTNVTSKIGKEFNCPYCNVIFEVNTTFNKLNSHVMACSSQNKNGISNLNELSIGDRGESRGKLNESDAEDEAEAESESLYEQLNALNELYGNVKEKDERPLELKIEELRNRLNLIKIDWRESHCKIELNREFLLKESIKKYEKIDPFKELKINFTGEVSHDAGGIIREWFTLIIKELQSPELYLFEKGDTVEFSYIIKRNLTSSPKNLEYFNFLGKLIAKALLDNITLNLCFNKIIYKLLLNEAVNFEDLFFIDKPLYNSLNELKKMNKNSIKEMYLFYVVEYRDDKGSLIIDELKTNGSNIQVLEINDYITKRIEYMMTKNAIFISEMKKGLYKVIPDNYLSAFNSDEFELMLNGRPFIDVDEWKANTTYQAKYNSKNKVVKWFWEAMSTLTQEELSRFLQFCTGSSRVPLGGFSALESNRGDISPFCIVQVIYNAKCTNYIRAHTCFNRIDLPAFIKEKQVKDAISYIINNEILGFGID